MKKSFLGILLLAGAAVLNAEETPGALAPKINGWNGDAAKIQSAESDAPGAWEVTGFGQFFSKETLPVNPAKGYRVSGDFRVPEGVPPQKLYFGMVMYDAAGEIIKPQWIFAVKDTLTALSAPAAIGDKSIRIKDGANWKTGRIYLAAFHAQADEKDLPNRNVSPVIEKITPQPDGGALLELAAPLTAAYPEGAAVRMHLISAPYLYVAANNAAVNGEWAPYAGAVRGYRFWPGTARAGIVLLFNVGGNAGSVIQVKNVKMEETP